MLFLFGIILVVLLLSSRELVCGVISFSFPLNLPILSKLCVVHRDGGVQEAGW